MATIRRGTIVKDTIDALKLQVGGVMPDQTSDKFVLTYDFSNVRNCNIVKTGASNGTFYTTPSDKDFYLTAIQVTAECTGAASPGVSVTAIPFNETSAVEMLSVYLRGTATVDAASGQNSISFPVPVKLARNTAIALVASTSNSRRATIFGYTVDG